MEIIESQKYGMADLALIAEKAKEYIANAKSPRTREIYRLGWHDFSDWCISKGLTPLPASPETVVAFLIERAQTLKMSTLELRLVSIRQAHSMAGYLFDKGHALITETFKGIKNIHGEPQTSKTPILLEDLQFMLQKLDDSLHGVRDRALLLLGFTGAFRRSELVCLKVEDLKFIREGIEVLLRRSKTDQSGRGHIVPIPYGSNPFTCPVRSIQSWIEASGITEGYLLRGINRHGHVSERGMCSKSVALIIKRNSHLQANESMFAGHSLRAGFCTTAAMKGVPEHSIMRQSRHKKSDTVKKYIRMASMWQDCAATKLGL